MQDTTQVPEQDLEIRCSPLWRRPQTSEQKDPWTNNGQRTMLNILVGEQTEQWDFSIYSVRAYLTLINPGRQVTSPSSAHKPILSSTCYLPGRGWVWTQRNEMSCVSSLWGAWSLGKGQRGADPKALGNVENGVFPFLPSTVYYAADGLPHAQQEWSHWIRLTTHEVRNHYPYFTNKLRPKKKLSLAQGYTASTGQSWDSKQGKWD